MTEYPSVPTGYDVQPSEWVPVTRDTEGMQLPGGVLFRITQAAFAGEGKYGGPTSAAVGVAVQYVPGVRLVKMYDQTYGWRCAVLPMMTPPLA